MTSSDFLSLPTEIISHILSYLRPFEIERAARTYNKTITPICLPLLRERLPTAKNSRKMIALFGGPPGLDTRGQFAEIYTSAGLALEWGPFSVPDLPSERQYAALDYLDIRGDLHWLAPLDECTTKAYRPWEAKYPAASEEQMDELLATADKLGLKLPACFSRIMTNLELQNRIPLGFSGNLKLSQPVKLWSSKVIQSKGTPNVRVDGYAIQFLYDLYADYYWYLHLDTTGGECVLGPDLYPKALTSHSENKGGRDTEGSESKSKGTTQDAALTSADKELGIGLVDVERTGFTLCATGFEEFLARTYFDQLASFYRFDKDEEKPILSPALKEYLVNVFSTKDRALR